VRILYTTDLHGDAKKYKELEKAALRGKIDVVINGGDLYPGFSKEGQRGFLNEVFREHLGFFDIKKIYYLAFPGNYDVKALDPLFDEICREFEFALNPDKNKVRINEYDFIGMNLVSDYPFRLKDRCRMDTRDFEFPLQHGSAIFSSEGDFIEMSTEEWFKYARKLSTLKEELMNLPQTDNAERTIYIIHMPPANLGLDRCYDNRGVGSYAIYEFIKENQPLLTLHGHIHESPRVSGIWKAHLGKTIAIQPGQEDKFIYVIINIEGSNLEVSRIKV
jgi:Icc-related predicted phosphoesterase